MSANATVSERPSHIPEDLVMVYPFTSGALTLHNPFKKAVHDIHKHYPPIFYAEDVYHGGGSAWIIRRQEDLKEIYADTEHFSNHGRSVHAGLLGESWVTLPSNLEGEIHDKFRMILNPIFSPVALRKLEPDVAKLAQDLVDKFKTKGAVDIKAAFCVPFPVSIVLNLLDLPLDRMDEFMHWEFGLLHDPNLDHTREAAANVVAMFRELMKVRRANPGEDLVSWAVTAEVDGRPWTDDEIVGFCFNLFIGGLDTVTTNLSWFLRHLAEHPDQQAYLRENPKKIPDAVQELLRLYSSVNASKNCIKEVTFKGVTFMPGDKIMTSTTLGSNDPEVYDHPEEARFDRRATAVTFGSGVHHCLGHFLARRELTIGLETVLRELPPFTLDTSQEIVVDLGGIMQPRTVPIVWAV